MLHLMIVDDDFSVVNILKDIVSQHLDDVMVSTAMTGREAIDKITLEQPDVVLLDYLLPDCDGLQVIRRIREAYNPSVIMISEVSDKQMIAKAYHEKISFFITKPINVVEVVSVVSQVISSHMAHKTLKSFEMAIRVLNHKAVHVEDESANEEKALKRIYSRLGIMGVSGCDDLVKAVLWAKRQKGDYALSELYVALVNHDVKGRVDDHQVQAVKKRI
ncbi:MAG TPA: response regulator receiver protein, partial [Clostridiales bacterium UBA8960]|nr:response regulator receiver protein [Clostridiales bacterium UBA8960]